MNGSVDRLVGSDQLVAWFETKITVQRHNILNLNISTTKRLRGYLTSTTSVVRS